MRQKWEARGVHGLLDSGGGRGLRRAAAGDGSRGPLCHGKALAETPSFDPTHELPLAFVLTSLTMVPCRDRKDCLARKPLLFMRYG
jgi:hypothetical protein